MHTSVYPPPQSAHRTIPPSPENPLVLPLCSQTLYPSPPQPPKTLATTDLAAFLKKTQIPGLPREIPLKQICGKSRNLPPPPTPKNVPPSGVSGVQPGLGTSRVNAESWFNLILCKALAGI